MLHNNDIDGTCQSRGIDFVVPMLDARQHRGHSTDTHGSVLSSADITDSIQRSDSLPKNKIELCNFGGEKSRLDRLIHLQHSRVECSSCNVEAAATFSPKSLTSEPFKLDFCRDVRR